MVDLPMKNGEFSIVMWLFTRGYIYQRTMLHVFLLVARSGFSTRFFSERNSFPPRRVFVQFSPRSLWGKAITFLVTCTHVMPRYFDAMSR